MIYIYRRRPSDSALKLAEALGGRRIRSLDRVHMTPEDRLVCWGESFGFSDRTDKVLNGGPISNKFEDALVLMQANVPTIDVSRTRPLPPQPLDKRVELARLAGELQGALMHGWNEPAARSIIATLQSEIDRPDPIAPEWLPRKFSHVGGNDLLSPPVSPDYFSKKENLVREYRVHSFGGKSIRAGIKKAIDIDGAPSHPWIRSFDAGWRIVYGQGGVSQHHRDLAHRATAALGLHFGAVDIGEKSDGSLIVLEVNRAPGLDGGTIDAYARAIQNWAESSELPSNGPQSLD